MPKRKVCTAGAAKAEHRLARPSAKPAPAKVVAKPKKAGGVGAGVRSAEIKHQTKRVQIKGKRGAKSKQAELADQQTTDLPTGNGETENQSPASEEKEAKYN